MPIDNANASEKYTCVILCGGQSLRMRFEFPNKILAPIDNIPLLHHLLDYYCSTQVFNKFVLCLGHESEAIIASFNESNNFSQSKWKGTDLILLETGLDVTATNRIYQSLPYINNDTFFLTYGDIVSNINFREMYSFYSENNNALTMSLVKAKMPYGKVLIDKNDRIYDFVEKPVLEHWINGGYFILNKNTFQSTDIDLEFESEFLPKFIRENTGKAYGYKHIDYWKGIDTYKDLMEIRKEWETVKTTKLFLNRAIPQ